MDSGLLTASSRGGRREGGRASGVFLFYKDTLPLTSGPCLPPPPGDLRCWLLKGWGSEAGTWWGSRGAFGCSSEDQRLGQGASPRAVVAATPPSEQPGRLRHSGGSASPEADPAASARLAICLGSAWGRLSRLSCRFCGTWVLPGRAIGSRLAGFCGAGRFTLRA